MPSQTAPETPTSAKGTLPAFTPVPRARERSNGWNPDVQRNFIEALADTGSVSSACRRVGRAEVGVYLLRRHPQAASFRAAWQAALDLGIQRIEDVAMDRALNGVEEPVYSYGALVGTRRKYNDRLLMFMLRNRAPERFAVGANGGSSSLKGLNAVGKMEKRRLKKKWHAKWQKQREEEERAASKHGAMPVAEARNLIDRKLGELRDRVNAGRTAEWKALTRETRDAYRHYETLRARDLDCEFAMPDHLPDEEAIAEEARLYAEEVARARKAKAPDHGTWSARPTGRPSQCEEASEAEASRPQGQYNNAVQLPPPGWKRWKHKEEVEEENPKIRRMKDEGW